MRQWIWKRLIAVAVGMSSSSAAPAGEWLPASHLFEPLLAAPNEPRFSASVRYYDSPDVDDDAFAFSTGETLPLYQFDATPNGVRRQIAVDGGVSGLLDTGSKSDALVNADYQIGGRLSWRHSQWSGRFRAYHQSSHLGDDYLIYHAVRYEAFRYESIEALVAYRADNQRLYGGGEYLWDRFPGNVGRTLLRGGYERHGTIRRFGGHPFVALDLRAWDERDWKPAVAALTGLEFDKRGSSRRIRIFIEGHAGYSPHGQFFVNDANWLGLGTQFSL